VRLGGALLAVLLGGAASPVASAQTGAPPGSNLTVYLMTMGPGEEVWERFGHNAIWIHDSIAGTDIAYNYGLFDFHQQDFLPRFIRGQMWYWMAGFPAQRYVETYVHANRSVWLQELDLSPSARLELQRFLEWNERPENRFYHYDYYKDNCSTRVRDALDRVIGNRIRAATADVPTGKTYRFHTQRLTANDPPIFTGLLLALGPGVDRPISRWEEMFLPLALRDHIRSVRIPGVGGATVPLVKSERTLFVSTAPTPPDAPPQWLLQYLMLGLVVGGLAAVLGMLSVRSSGARVGLGVLLIGWGVVAGFAGTVLAGLWAFTDHVMAYRNENLFQVNPLAWLLVLPGALALLSPPRAGRWAWMAAVVLAGLAVLGFVLQILPGLDQVNGPIIALALPVHLGMALALNATSRRGDSGRPGLPDSQGRR
jgi:hypothetical protein